MAAPPPLPPRKPSPVIPASQSEAVPPSASASATPPPLPPRTKPRQPALQPILVEASGADSAQGGEVARGHVRVEDGGAQLVQEHSEVPPAAADGGTASAGILPGRSDVPPDQTSSPSRIETIQHLTMVAAPESQSAPIHSTTAGPAVPEQVTGQDVPPGLASAPARPSHEQPPTVSVSIPSTGNTPTEATHPIAARTAAAAEPATAPANAKAPIYTSTAPPLPPRAPNHLTSLPASLPLSLPLPLPLSSTTGPHPWHIYTLTLVLLAYLRLPLFWLLLAAGAGLYVLKAIENAEARKEGGEKLDDMKEGALHSGDGKLAVEWVNHALYALFPLVSTDVLTPFIDLMEDALADEVPAPVTSVRLASPSLGSQPIVLTSLRPMSDQEWFACLSTSPSHAPSGGSEGKTHRRAKSSSSKPPLPGGSAGGDLIPPPTPSKRYGHSRSASTHSLHPLSRTTSASSTGTTSGAGTDRERVMADVQSRRKRDRLLQKVTRRVPQNTPSHINPRDHPAGSGSGTGSGATSRSGAVPEDEASKPDGARYRGGWGGSETEEEDPDAGQYVNYQVGFEYKRGEEAMRKGRGLHVLAYFGIGVKGIGKAEVPVYIDVLHIKGTMNLRLLLSSTPPFVRTGTFSFPSLPEYDVSANPLKRGSFNAMDLPLMKSYVKKSIKSVLAAFLRPHSYTLDIDRLLLGSPSALRTTHIGVLHLILHRAEDLPKADTMGSCDPYLEVGFERMRRPVFSTRTIGKTMDPVWEEECFVLVSSDAIEAGETLRIRANDADRFSADDTLGVVLADLADLVAASTSAEGTSGDGMQHRADAFTADQPGMRTSGVLFWSVRFCPLWQMSPAETSARIERARAARRGPIGPDGGEAGKEAWWIEWLKGWVPDREEWEEEREERRRETVEWLKGEKEREMMEADEGASEERPCGILQFHIHQCIDLEIEPTSGTYSSTPRSATGGPPALAHLTERTPTENPDPPSAYCEVHLNDKLVYRTRTKEVTPMPYFNAVSERFVRDWTKGKVIFVVRDDRDREHDPVLGLVEINLAQALASTSHFTRWFPLTSGLGWGRLRLSLLWKPLDMSVPRGIAGYEVAVVQLRKLVFTPLDGGAGGGAGDRGEWRGVRVRVRTDSDKKDVVLVDGEPGTPSSSRFSISGGPSTGSPSARPLSTGSLPDTFAASYAFPPGYSPALAVMYRHSCSLHLVIECRLPGLLKKRRVVGEARLRLGDVSDGEGTRRVEVWSGGEPVGGEDEYDWEGSGVPGGDGDVDNDSLSVRSPETPAKSPALTRVRTSLSRRSSRSRSISSARQPHLVGCLDLEWAVVPGISRVHKKVAKRDLRFGRVFEAWELARDMEGRVGGGGRAMGVGGERNGGEGDDDGESESDSDEEEGEEGDEGERRSADVTRESVEEGMGEMSESRAHSHALHKRHKGIFQLKIARTGRFMKDKLGAKVHNATNGRTSGSVGDGRVRGSDLEVEREGLSRL
ncbi:hypothetical protein IAT38_007084 [Cryptococcus sp. DSM 104549]